MNQDTLKSRDQCVAAVRRAISAGKSAVVGTKKYYYCYCMDSVIIEGFELLL